MSASIPNIEIKNAVELEITTKCHLKCFNCDRSCRQAPSDERMSLKQIKLFLDETRTNQRQWEYIAILGGEPTLHPKFWKILDEFIKNNIRAEIITNGYGEIVNHALNQLPNNWFSVCNTKKQSPYQSFIYYNLAPIDFGIKNAPPCWILKTCGYGLTRYGYYPCGAGASIDRVFGFDIGVKSLKNLTPENTTKQLEILCKYCGHSPTMDELQSSGKINVNNYETEKELALDYNKCIAPMSESWIKAYDKYKKNKPKLRLYGNEV